MKISSLVWKPSINLLPFKDQERVIKELCAKPSIDLDSASPAASTEAQTPVQPYRAISELIKLLHHCNPSLSIAEAFSINTAQPILS